jgi:hypothetical protein
MAVGGGERLVVAIDTATDTDAPVAVGAAEPGIDGDLLHLYVGEDLG